MVVLALEMELRESGERREERRKKEREREEFFYDQVPNELRSMGLALYLSIIGVGSFLSGFLISLIEHFTGKDGHETWFCDNINKAHLDYFYWILAGLSVMGFTLFIYFAKSYIYNHKGVDVEQTYK
ncbi:oligopeptide transporter, putative [Medicago truncatula]|uniref:Oligopeptide transporter, putative n=1 Tax=Medicago truncatula TaxID=3880 RepID=A0A072UTX1_MEDTR|nr:oligopeptide transporter, putative [Medicago truncatula]